MSPWTIPWHPTNRMLRQFAGLWLLFVGALAVRVTVAFGPLPGAGVATAAIAIGVAGLVRPASVRPVFLAASLLAWPIGWVVSHVLLLTLFYGLFTPVALLFRLIDRDALDRHFRPQRASYWEPKATADDPARYLQTF